MLYVFEGLDGSGKSTIIRKVKRELEERGWDVVVIREPDDEYRKKACNADKRLDSATEYELMESCHDYLQEKVAKEKGKVILSDRSFLYSSLAYQAHSDEEMDRLRAYHLLKEHQPARVYLMDTEPDICRVRALGAREDEKSVFDKEGLAKYEERYHRYMRMKDYPEVEVINCGTSIERICDEIAQREE